MTAGRSRISPASSWASTIGSMGWLTTASARDQVASGGNVAGAKQVGKLIAERAKAQGVTKVVFDRGGYLYHGRVKALADAAREAGLEF